jgi:hypothetical protein
MEITFNAVDHIVVLGAGASVDYGLPTWNDLGKLIKEKITPENNQYQNRSDILAWLDKIGTDKQYGTLDECITKESVSTKHYDNGHEIENQIFEIVNDVFSEKYKLNPDGWIKILNEKILSSETELEKRIGFINYNYDDVLIRNFLDFSYLPAKHQRYNFKDRLNTLIYTKAVALYPHGHFFTREDMGNDSHIESYKETMKSDDDFHLDVVACYESKTHHIKNLGKTAKLYVLGLGGGLKINLDNIHLKTKISEVHITVRDESRKSETLAYLCEKYNVSVEDVYIYSNCDDLIENCLVLV